MKKFLLFLVLALCTLNVFAQTEYRYTVTHRADKVADFEWGEWNDITDVTAVFNFDKKRINIYTDNPQYIDFVNFRESEDFSTYTIYTAVATDTHYDEITLEMKVFKEDSKVRLTIKYPTYSYMYWMIPE